MAQEAGGNSHTAALAPICEQVAGCVTAVVSAKSVLHRSP